jgi:formylglycine-generating enzyme required for sulfatase activity
LPTAPGASASYIWDFAGNLGEWVSSDYEGSDWTQLPNDFVDYDADDYKYLAEIFGPAIPAASKGYGKIKSSHMNSTDSPAVYRGGSHLWSYENVGIYSAKFVPESYAAPDVGFRCVYRP